MNATLGVDAGSRDVKFAMIGPDGVILKHTIDTVQFYIKCRGDNRRVDLKKLEAESGACGYERIVATGYGRNNVEIDNCSVIPEIMAHAKGAVYQTGLADFTLVDLGGQDTKVISVKNGTVDDFVMNDKCAAGSGRYLENIANTLGVSMDRLSECEDDPLVMSNTCAIFGESEVVGLVSDGEPLERILAGANRTVVMRLLPMLGKFRNDTIVTTGGVAKNRAIRAMMARETGARVIAPEAPQLNGAIGCCMS